MGWEDMVWIQLSQDRVQCQVNVNKIMNLQVPYKTWNILTDLRDYHLSIGNMLHGVIKVYITFVFKTLQHNWEL
jgi:hypothetical protein